MTAKTNKVAPWIIQLLLIVGSLVMLLYFTGVTNNMEARIQALEQNAGTEPAKSV